MHVSLHVTAKVLIVAYNKANILHKTDEHVLLSVPCATIYPTRTARMAL
jgi:hypothetical protein